MNRIEEITFISTLDKSQQPAIIRKIETDEKRPLLVFLHSWSCKRDNRLKENIAFADKLKFHLLQPEFRGPNLTSNENCTQACASKYAMQDVMDAIEFAIEYCNADSENVFLLGGSGGGHMALMMAGYAPERFKAIASYVPISDLNRWQLNNKEYRPHVLACCSNSEEEMLLRSPINYIENIAKANLKIFHGKYDPIVSCAQSIDLYNEIFTKYPECRVFLDIFDGGHEFDLLLARYWFESQYSDKEKTMVTN